MREDRHVIPSVLEPNAEAAERGLAAARADLPLVELRADHLRPGEVAGLVRRVGRPLIVAARRRADGGRFGGSEEERGNLLRAALKAGARYVDVERESPPLDPGEWRGQAARIILSDHGSPCETAQLGSLYAEMTSSPAAVIKIVPRAATLGQTPAVGDLLRRAGDEGRRLACFALGRAGALTRLLAPSWGSWATYASVRPGAESGRGQFVLDDMIDLYDVLGIDEGTRRFALVGSRVFGSPSPAMHRAAYAGCGLKARYLPVEVDDVESLLPLLERDGPFGFEALAVTMPLKERMAERCRRLEPPAAEAGAVNTVLPGPDGWRGFNTDGPAAAELIRQRLDPRGARAAIVGAGGTARAIAVALRNAGAEVTLFGRTGSKAREAAASLGVASRPLGRLGRAEWEILVNATPLGGEGERVLEPSRLRGRLVLDAVYRVPPTPLAAAASRRGLEVIDGMALLAGQAELQFRRMTGWRVEAGLMAAAGMQWLSGRSA
jgi:3-dehydroquinate dehydratase/shikimate dehydrogenase